MVDSLQSRMHRLLDSERGRCGPREFEWVQYGDDTAHRRVRSYVKRIRRHGDNKGNKPSVQERAQSNASRRKDGSKTGQISGAREIINQKTVRQVSQDLALYPNIRSERDDLLGSLPFKLGQRENLLIDHFLTGVVPPDFQLDSRANFTHIKRLSLENAFNSPSALHVVLSIAAGDIAMLHGGQYFNEALAYRGAALAGVRKALVDRGRGSKMIDECITAMTLLVAIEIMSGNSDAFNIHMNGIALMVEARGGLELLQRSNSQLYSLISCYEYAGVCSLLSRHRLITQTPVSSPISPMSSSPLSASSSSSVTVTPSDSSGLPLAILSSLPAHFDLPEFIVSIVHTLQTLTQLFLTDPFTSPSANLQQSIATVTEEVEFELYRSLCIEVRKAMYGRTQYIIQAYQILVLLYSALFSRMDLGSPLNTLQLFTSHFQVAMHRQSPDQKSWSATAISLFKSVLADSSANVLDMTIGNIVDRSIALGSKEWKEIRQQLLDFLTHDKLCEGRIQELWKLRFVGDRSSYNEDSDS